MTRQIPLTHGLVAIVDDADYPALADAKWHARRDPKRRTSYAACNWNAGGERGIRLMHRVILGVTEPRLTVDHVDGDGLNNTRANLRICSQGENNRNRGKAVDNTTGYKGVGRERTYYRAQISADNRKVRLGSFSCPVLAARAYDAAARELHGEFANLNFKPDRDWLFPQEVEGSWPPARAELKRLRGAV